MRDLGAHKYMLVEQKPIFGCHTFVVLSAIFEINHQGEMIMKVTIKQTLAAATLAVLSSTAFAAEHVVEMKNSGAEGAMVFEPGYVNADPGDTVKFVLVDQAHNSTSVEVPEGAKSWEGAINEGITVTVEEEGVYVYKCTPHAALNMTGVIQVGEATNYDSAKQAVDTLTENAATNKDRLTGYFEQVQK